MKNSAKMTHDWVNARAKRFVAWDMALGTGCPINNTTLFSLRRRGFIKIVGKKNGCYLYEKIKDYSGRKARKSPLEKTLDLFSVKPKSDLAADLRGIADKVEKLSGKGLGGFLRGNF
jgi:hypothetical protein